MNKPRLISIIMTSYNWSAALVAVLHALNRQTDRHFELLIGDDGSGPDEFAVIRDAIHRCAFPVQLLWQEDQGFRAAKARNQAVVQAKGEYLVFLDGDCIPPPNFIARHRRLAERGFWVSGNRILFSERFTKQLLTHEEILVKQTMSYWCMQRLRGNINRCLPLLYWPFSLGRKNDLRAWKGAKTCNLGVWKHDFLKINGFDERYQGWGYEDSDLVIRLIRSGVYRKNGRFAIPVFHLWHTEQDRSSEPENLARLEMIMGNGEQRASLGVDQYR